MKPIIIYPEELSTDKTKIIMSKADFETYINVAYEQGKKDAAGVIVTSPVVIPREPTPVYEGFTCGGAALL